MKSTSSNSQTTAKMKAIVRTEYGCADVLRWAEVERPYLQDNGVMVRVRATSVHAGDWHLMRGQPFLIRLMFGGLLKPKIEILGCDIAGEVVAVGKQIAHLKLGDRVFGDLSECGFGAFAEYVCVPERALVTMPPNLTYEEAATVPVSALAALQGLRDLGRIQAGQKVLINGAAGGVGSFAVQIAKAWGAEVTARCSREKFEMVRAIGADFTLDRTHAPLTLDRHHYDIILDTAAYDSLLDYLPALSPTGVYVMVGGSTARFFQALFLEPWFAKTSRHEVKCLTSQPNPEDLMVLRDLLAAQKIRPSIDRTYSLRELPVAIRALEQRQVRGKVAISV
jgi:NADPH:quinone reductase-like Zn-dependent oxidoreductase